MKQIRKAIFACSLAALAATSHAAEKTRTKSNNPNERAVASSEAGSTSDEVVLLWGSDKPADVHVLSGTATPTTGPEWSFGASNQSSASSGGMGAGKVAMQDMHVAKSSGPGTMSLSFDGPAGGACPVAYDAVSPIKGVGVVIKKNPGGSAERLSFSDVTVRKCDTTGITFSYAKGTKSWQLTR